MEILGRAAVVNALVGALGCLRLTTEFWTLLMATFEVFDPSGATEVTQLHAPRLDSLEGKTIAFLSNDMWQTHRMFPMLQEMLEARNKNIYIIPETEFPMGTTVIDMDETADLFIERGVDAVIVGNAA